MTASTIARARAEAPGALAVYRDDGPLARALGAVLGRLGLPELVLVVAAVVPILALIAFGGDDVSEPAAGAAIAWMVLCGGAASGSPPGGGLRWALLPVLRLTEYATLLWLAALAGPSSYPAAFALLAALVFRHYDLVYRMRLRGIAPAPWVDALSLGWDGRLVGAYVLLVAGALPDGFYLAAAVLGGAFAGEAVSVWVGAGRRAQQPAELDDEEDEEE
jgi:hypothetical protein